MPAGFLTARLGDAPRAFGELVSTTFAEFASRQGKPRWGDKTPGYVAHLEILKEVFGSIKVIHLIRDGRDVACSLRSVSWYTGSVMDAAIRWKRMILSARRTARRLSEGEYCEVRYEALTSDSCGTLRRICEFLGETFEQGMLGYYESAEQHIPSHRTEWHQKTTRPVTSAQVARWRNDMSPSEVAVFECWAGSVLQKLGYETSGGSALRALPLIGGQLIGRAVRGVARTIQLAGRQSGDNSV